MVSNESTVLFGRLRNCTFDFDLTGHDLKQRRLTSKRCKSANSKKEGGINLDHRGLSAQATFFCLSTYMHLLHIHVFHKQVYVPHSLKILLAVPWVGLL